MENDNQSPTEKETFMNKYGGFIFLFGLIGSVVLLVVVEMYFY